VRGLAAHFDHAAQEGVEPSFPVAGIAPGLEAVVIFGAQRLRDLVGRRRNERRLSERASACSQLR
jgi:hypothetical protein